MKRRIMSIAIAMGLFVGLAGVAVAGGGHGQFNEEKMEQRMEKRVERMTSKLKLSAQQETEVRRIFEGNKAKIKELKANADMSREDRKAQMKLIRQATREDIGKILTDEQKVLAKEMRKEHRQDGKRGKHGKKGKHFKRMVKELDLSDAQQAGVKQIRQDARVERDVILEANNGDRKAARPELKAHRKATGDKIRKLLNPEQREKFDRHRAEKREKKHRKGKRGQDQE